MKLIAEKHGIDAKTAISYLEDRSGKRTSIYIPSQVANEIADLIRRQEVEISDMQMMDGMGQ